MPTCRSAGRRWLQAARTAGWMALLGAPIMLVLFMLFPRMAPLWGTPERRHGRTHRAVGHDARGHHGGARARRQASPRASGSTAPLPPQSDLYFRGPVLSSSTAANGAPRLALRSRGSVPANLRVRGTPVGYEVTLEPTNRPWLLTLDAAPAKPRCRATSSSRRRNCNGSRTAPSATWCATAPRATRSSRAGRARRAAVPAGLRRAAAGLEPAHRRAGGADARDPALAGARPGRWSRPRCERLRTGGYAYTLEPGLFGDDTADEFWFDRKAGFCEHIASAFVVLMRALDIPARIVTGYQGGELNGVDDFWVVRNSDAHAWAEVWQAGRGLGARRPHRRDLARPHRPVPPAGGAARPDRRRHRHHEPDAVAEPARRLGGGQQRLEPVGAQLHAEPPAGPAKTSASRRPACRTWLRAARAAGGRQPRRRRPGRSGSAASTTPGCGCWAGRASGCSQAGIELPEAAPPRQMAPGCTDALRSDARGAAQMAAAARGPALRESPAASLRGPAREFRQLAWPR